MTTNLSALGFTPFFSQQLTGDELESTRPMRVVEVQRSGVTVSDGELELHLPLESAWFRGPPDSRPTVGDWVLVDAGDKRVLRLLERRSVFKRVAAGEKVDVQLIAANVDTLFIVLSCNDDFNASRLERYLALATEACVYPVVVLTKSDLTDSAEEYRRQAQAVAREAPVEVVNALDADCLDGLRGRVSSGSTVALVGSSGVGKSTLVNTLAGRAVMATSGIREKDAKGRHTTSFRALHLLEGGGILLDVPGMRELKVADVSDALGEVFDDIESLAGECRFSDCLHESEPGCAVQEAVSAGRLEPRRLANYKKLQREDAHHNQTLAERRESGRAFGKVVRDAMAAKRNRTGR